MRTTLKLVAIIAYLCLSVSTYGQKKVTLEQQDCPVEKILKIISKQSGYHFFYDSRLLQDAHNVTILCKNVSLKQALELVCMDQPFTYEISNNTFTIKERLINISGSITNEQNQMVPGVTIQVANTNKSTISNSNGTFYFRNISPKAILILNAVGMKVETVPVNGAVFIPIQLKSAYPGMPAVTVYPTTGYLRMPASLITGSFGIVGSELIRKRIFRGLEQGLEGSLSGMQGIVNKTAGINQSKYFQIGPRVTLNGNPDPLIIVDQFPYVGDLSDLNLDDIESIVILKDAAAASIWGARGGNGVMVITTKTGKYNQGLRVTFNNYITTGMKLDLFYPDVMNPSDRIDIDTFLFGHNYTRPFERNLTPQALSPALELLLKWKNKEISLDQLEAQLNAWRKQDVRNDIESDFYRKPFASHLWTDITGGNNQFNYRLSLGYDDGLPALKNSKDVRKTICFVGNFRPYSGVLEGTVSVNGAQQIQYNTGGGPIIPVIYGQLADANGKAIAFPFQYRQPILDSLNGLGYLDGSYYPKTEFDLRNQTLTNENIRAQIGITFKMPWNLLRGLEASFNSQYQQATAELLNLKNQQAYDVRSFINRYTQITTNGLERPVHWGDMLEQANTKMRAQHTRWQLSYIKKWSNLSEFSIMTGLDRTRIKEKSYSNLIYGYSEATPNGQINLDFNNIYPLSYPSNSFAQIPTAAPGKTANQVILSYYSAVGFQYKKQLSISATGRFDRSNLFGKTTNRNSIPLLSAGVSWDLHATSFYQLSYLLPELTIRGSYGSLGNISASATMFPTITPVGYNRNGDRMSSATNPPLSILQWESIKTLDIGLNFKFAKNILSGSLDFYQKRSANLLDDLPIDPTTGDATVRGNLGKMTGHQLDLVLTSQNLKRGLEWSTRLFFSLNNETVKQNSNKLRPAWEYCEGGYLRSVPGRPPYGVYSFKYLGLDNAGNPTGILNDHDSKDYSKILTEEGYRSLRYHGRSTPAIFGSLSNEFVWRQFNLSISILYKLKYYYRRHSIFYNDTYKGIDQGSKDFAGRWKEPGDEVFTNIPSMIFPINNDRDLFYKYSEVLIEKGDHIRLQFVHLNYSLNPAWFKKSPFNACSLYINASNLGILWRAGNPGVDPDQTAGYLTRAQLSIGVRGSFK